ncbi:hypothetical protein, conserved [Trypanosoma brucei brucei TREU927]|uniref:Uncharacterized protein n=1 Tax=Trypanosoma brucei brucei (strain 927/4 GUTat10.1) TaxID=185431 RepID=Q38F56_TRYB2|nr:hypothetical protein, conserved [Trypanosoma brucei brucei TREU927]EAN76564.1 hypothetical protein, conserved [Trypanosoma brucei brucei TREU927]
MLRAPIFFLFVNCRADTMAADDESAALLHRLGWLVERSKVGFKGNPPPFESAKTQKSVEIMKRKEKRKLAGGTSFKPFIHGPPRLAEDSRPTRHLRGIDTQKYDAQLSKTALSGRCQKLDRSTGCPEILAALCWDLEAKKPDANKAQKDPVGTVCHPDDGHRAATAGKNQYLLTLSKEEREAYYRSEAINHPKFTRRSREYREGLGWYHGSQLVGPLRKGSCSSEPKTRNCIRLVNRNI